MTSPPLGANAPLQDGKAGHTHSSAGNGGLGPIFSTIACDDSQFVFTMSGAGGRRNAPDCAAVWC